MHDGGDGSGGEDTEDHRKWVWYVAAMVDGGNGEGWVNCVRKVKIRKTVGGRVGDGG